MPYKSKAQQAYMHIHHPDIAREWDRKYKLSPRLPNRKRRKKS